MKTQIEIRGRRYTVRSDEDDVDLQALAAYVDRQIGDVAGRSASLDDYTAAMLAALNIASDYERLRRRMASELEILDRDIAATEAMLGASVTLEEG
ncbi:MAG: cell division protein ZapA [Proteobacteria bacterium]|nr:cell division protein ZapA [Pseudomonadota bacterium]